ncbi:MAG: DNA polymerase III subunit chi [Granulosicoccus sp.]|nr:DNA polymerase III subunit chi [Granulosicoccus sp.]
MTRIDFYVLTGDDTSKRLRLVCNLAEKAIGRHQKVFIYSDSEAELSVLDQSLWDFRAMSYVAHQLLPVGHVASSMDTDPVQLSSGEPAIDRDLLINLAQQVPSFFSRFHRTLEIVNEEPAIQVAGRDRYRFYQQRGYPLQHHKI